MLTVLDGLAKSYEKFIHQNHSSSTNKLLKEEHFQMGLKEESRFSLLKKLYITLVLALRSLDKMFQV